MMGRWVVIVALLGCSKPKHEPPPPPPAPPVADAVTVVADAVVAPLPEHGVPGSAVASAPRKDWPCRMVTTIDAGTTLLTKLSYSTRTSCWIPVDLAGSRALVGCPEERLEQNIANKLDLREQYGYDDAGHLTTITTIAGVFRYRWDGDLLISREIPRRAPTGYVAMPGGADIVDPDGNREHVELAGGHIVHYQRGDSEDITYTWKGTRLVGMKDIGGTRIDYDCSKSL